jgi:hypothetical protein
MKQWLKLAATFGTFAHFDRVKRAGSLDELFALLGEPPGLPRRDRTAGASPAAR